jgi:FlaA1/EpsC-like NDP-sugar epimerase
MIVALWIAFSLRFSSIYYPPREQLWIFFLAPIIAIPIFIKFGLYRAIIRYIGVDALGSIFKSVALFTLIFSVIVLVAVEYSGLVPRTVYGIHALIVLLMVGGSRLIARWWFLKEKHRYIGKDVASRYLSPVLIYGAGSAGIQLAAALNAGTQHKVVAYIDDDVNLHKQSINGLIAHPLEKLPLLIDKYNVSDILLAMPSISRNRRNEIIQTLESYPIHVKMLPDLAVFAEGKITVSDIQEVDIADILGREAVEPIDCLLHLNVTNKIVMVTGAGGSIGSELCRQIVKLSPKLLVLFELNEFGLYAIEKELHQLNGNLEVKSILGSVQDQQRLEQVCKRFNVETIYHAAAYKHVPLVEKNIIQGVKNNIFGTLCSANAAINAGVKTFVLISTDKAVRPTNTMGATKRFSELVLQALANEDHLNQGPRFTMVRFGNVLDSSGSVVPLFRDQIANGGPVTVTDPDIIRYFMTIPEAAELVIQAGAMGRGGDVFVLNMGEPVRIIDLAKRMIHLSGFVVKDKEYPEGDIEIVFTGLRPGEKLYEELLIGDNVEKTEHLKIMRAQEKVISWQVLSSILQDLHVASDNNNYSLVREILMKYVDGFEPQCAIEDWLL